MADTFWIPDAASRAARWAAICAARVLFVSSVLPGSADIMSSNMAVLSMMASDSISVSVSSGTDSVVVDVSVPDVVDSGVVAGGVVDVPD